MAMDKHDWLAEQFEGYRAHLRTVAYRMLGSLSDADDAVQASWLRLSRADAGSIENMGGWLTTVVARVSLDMLRSRSSHPEESLDAQVVEPPTNRKEGIDPEHEALLADSVGLALLVILDRLDPAERLAYVLHDMFAMPFEDIAPIVGRSPAAARQLASRARRQIQGAPVESNPDLSRKRDVVTAFLNASRTGDFQGLLAVLDPDVVFRADAAAMLTGAASELRGAEAVANNFNGRARAVQPALIDGVVGAVWGTDNKIHIAFNFTIVDGKIIEIELFKDPERLDNLDVVLLDR